MNAGLCKKDFLIFLSLKLIISFSLRCIIIKLYCFIFINKGEIMAKGKDVQKSVKTAPTKTLKEKRADKKAKKDSK